jgi:hypothetical protein
MLPSVFEPSVFVIVRLAYYRASAQYHWKALANDCLAYYFFDSKWRAT